MSNKNSDTTKAVIVGGFVGGAVGALAGMMMLNMVEEAADQRPSQQPSDAQQGLGSSSNGDDEDDDEAHGKPTASPRRIATRSIPPTPATAHISAFEAPAAAPRPRHRRPSGPSNGA